MKHVATPHRSKTNHKLGIMKSPSFETMEEVFFGIQNGDKKLLRKLTLTEIKRLAGVAKFYRELLFKEVNECQFSQLIKNKADAGALRVLRANPAQFDTIWWRDIVNSSHVRGF